MTKEAQIEEWMATKPVIREAVNGEIREITGEARRPIFEAAYDEIAAANDARDEWVARKTWPNAAAFLGEFSLNELAAISLSIDPTIAALRLLLASWTADIWSDEARIQLGLAKIVEAGIINETRKAAILQKA
jgi:hypothetical protein